MMMRNVNPVRLAIAAPAAKSPRQQKAHHWDGLFASKTMEREKRLELSTYTLARYRSTN